MFATLNHVATLDLSKDGRKELPLNWEPKKITSFYHIMTALIKKKKTLQTFVLWIYNTPFVQSTNEFAFQR